MGLGSQTAKIKSQRRIFTFQNIAPNRVAFSFQVPTQLSKAIFVHDPKVSKTKTTLAFFFSNDAPSNRVKVLFIIIVSPDEDTLTLMNILNAVLRDCHNHYSVRGKLRLQSQPWPK